MIEIATSYGPSDHRSEVLEYSASADGCIRQLGIDNPGHISPVKLGQLDVTDNRQNIPT
jgi:hypothetical protein